MTVLNAFGTRPGAAAGVVLAVVAIAASACGGATNASVTHVLGAEDHDRANPTLAADGDRIAVAWGSTPQGGRTSVMTATSTDGGVTFGPPVRANDDVADVRVSGEMPPQVVFAGGGRVAVVWPARRGTASEIRFALSTDNGRTFAASRLANAEGVPGLRGWASAAADGRGLLHLAWLDGRSATSPAQPVAGSPTAGGTAAPAGGHQHGASSGTAPRQDLYRAVVSTDDAIAEMPVAADVCFCCKTSIAATAHGAEVAWRHIFPESIRDIAIAPLHDNAPPAVTRVSADDWQIDACPDDGPSLAIEASGTRHVVWPTMATGAVADKAVFYASSTDGRTFTPRERLSLREDGAASHPRLAVAADGTVAAVWDERSGGTIKVRMRVRRAGMSGWEPAVTIGQDGAPDAASLPAFYPVIGATTDGWVVAWTSGTQPRTAVVVRRMPR